MSNKISIIVPVYNVEKYLCQCVDSIIKQNYDNKEIILVDDGSTDGSTAICDSYAEKYDVIKVIHKENGGASDARNVGVLASTGEYILFVDSDDFIEPGALCGIANVVNENPVDLVFLEAQKYFKDGRTVPFGDGVTIKSVRGKDSLSVLEFLSKCPKFAGSPCTKLIKRELFEKNDLTFRTGIVAEDIDWCLKVFLSAKSFDYCGEMHYNYRQKREGSVTNGVGIKHFDSLLSILEDWVEKAKMLTKTEKMFVYSTLAYEYTILVMIYAFLDRKTGKKYIKRLRGLLWVLKYRSGMRYWSIKVLCMFIGYTLTSKLLKLYLKVR